MNYNKKYLFSFIVLAIMLTVGCFIYFNTRYVSYDYIEQGNKFKKGKVIVKIDNEIITENDIKNFRNLTTFSDQDILNKLIEDDILFLMAKENGIKVSKKDLHNLVLQSKNSLKQCSEEEKSKLNNIIKALNLTSEEYWNKYAPPTYAKAIMVGKMKTKIKDDIYKEIIEKHPKWTKTEIRKDSTEIYQEKINGFKKHHKIEKFLP